MTNAGDDRPFYSATGLLEFYQRTQQSFSDLLKHCRQLDDSELNRELEGFGYPTVRLQVHHVIGAERYWIGVLQGRIDADDDAPDFPNLSALESLRADVAKKTTDFLKGTPDAEWNRDRPMKTWQGREQVLNPAQVVFRTQTHCFHHQGQIAAMCRLLGKPSPGADYPIDQLRG